ncbi:MAG: methyltransferase, partial [Chloroflexota bacterium]
MFTVVTGCRSCGAPEPEPFLSLGEMPLADGLCTEEELREGREARYPLTVALCRRC